MSSKLDNLINYNNIAEEEEKWQKLLKKMWIKISSLKGADKENYIISNVCLLIGAIAWGFHLASVGALGSEYAEDAITATEFNIARICVVIFWGIGIYFYSKF